MTIAAPWYWKTLDFFDETAIDARRAFFDVAERSEYRKNELIFVPTDPATRIFYLASGIVKIYHLSAEGDPTIFWFCVPGDLFGAGGLSGSLQQSVYGQAIEPSAVFTIRRAAFEKVLKDHPQLAINVIRLMGARLRLACDSMTDLVSRMSDVRLARVLLRLMHNWGQPRGNSVVLRVKVTHEELANMIGASRQTVNEALRDFAERGFIQVKGRVITIPVPERLQDLIEGGALRKERAVRRGSSAGEVQRAKQTLTAGFNPSLHRGGASK